MKKFIADVLISVAKSLAVFMLMFLIAISFYTGKFPPNITLIKQQISDLAKAKEKYTNLLNKSEDYLNNKVNSSTQIQNDGEDTSLKTKFQLSDSASNTYETNLEALRVQIMHLQSQLNRIEDQNKLILNTLKK